MQEKDLQMDQKMNHMPKVSVIIPILKLPLHQHQTENNDVDVNPSYANNFTTDSIST